VTYCMKDWINCEITKINEETHDTKTFTLKQDQPFSFLPGQFVMLAFREGTLAEDKKAARAYSISSSTVQAKSKKEIDVTIRIYNEGKFTPEIFKSKIGSKLKLKGPYGRFNYRPEMGNDVVMIAAGSGIAPFIGFCKEVEENNLDTNLQLIYSDKTENDLISREYFESLEKQNKLKLTFTLTREDWKEQKGRIDQWILDKYVPEVKDKLFYICGPPEMVNTVTTLLMSRGVEAHKIKTEKYD
jgi:glycine betaine catabolism B